MSAGGAFPGCNDYVIESPPGPPIPANEPDTPTDLYRAGRVSPGIALRTQRDDLVYSAEGFLTA